jgi:hypothetical protein
VSQLVRPSLDAIRALWESRGGEPGTLPPLAGGAGWILHIPPFEVKQVGKTGSGQLWQATRKLIGQDTSPTKMEKWDFTALRIPVGFYIEWAEVPASLARFKAQAVLRRGGDVVWSQLQEAEGATVGGTGELIQVGNLLFSDNFFSPIELMQGQDLTLEVNFLWQGVKEAVQAKLLVSEYAYSSTKFERQEGNLQYNSQHLTGHRQL